ncbi:MAG: lactate racemase domain-containing protein [Gemmatales bacterium]|nr:nickel-dependent lactate racemase [Gemmatales bacterium]MDW7993190.1 lactate racemase domain-containing protein [Gemmatales bacterium]
MAYPKMVLVRQEFERPLLADVAKAVHQTLETLDLSRRIRPGQTVALTAGSRGIAHIAVILRETVRFLRRLGAEPFIVPAMGSHGGATAEGQCSVLQSYGITESFVEAPIRATMDVVTLGSTAEGFPVVLDRYAYEADHIGVVARIKPHTAFHGPIESGLLKMLMIGLGKHVGALRYHRILLHHPYDLVVRSVARHILGCKSVAFGLAIVENAYDETALIEAIPPEQFESREEQLLTLARQWLPKLPWMQADLLIVDEIGKEISGSGMDTNVVGRKRALRSACNIPQPEMRLIFVRDLSEKTQGNATGIGLADFTTSRLVRKMDYRATVINCLTAGYPAGAFIPVHFETDREVVDAALSIVAPDDPSAARVMRIRNTLQLEFVEASEACFHKGPPQTHCQPMGPPREMCFDSSGNLMPLGH